MGDGVIPDEYDRYVLAILFAALFASISWIAPATYLAVTPPADHIEIQSVSVNQTSNTTHNVSVEYSSRDRYPVEGEITLYREESAGDVAIDSWTTSSVIPPGEHHGSIILDLTDPPPAGTYYYEFELLIHADYNVEKEYTYETDSFPIENSSDTSALCCETTPITPDA